MANIDLTQYGITGTTEIVHNPSYDELFAAETDSALSGYEKGQVSELGAVNVLTGIYTGRSPKDKFIVMDENSKDTVWWTSADYANDNHPLSEDSWKVLKDLAKNELSNKKKFAEENLEKKKKKLIEDLNLTTKPMGFEVVEGAKGVFMLPVKDGKTLSKEEYEKLDQKEKVEYEKKSPQIQEKIFEVLTQIRGLEIEKEREMSNWKGTVASATLNVATKYLEQKYSDNTKIVEYIGNVKRDILQNISEFLESSHEELEDKRKMPGMPQKENIMERYNVNIFVDNSRQETIPLVMDVDYSFENIFGKVEYENQYGTLKTNFMKIKSGLIHKANGGYIVFQAKDLLREPGLYDTLKKVLKLEECGIEVSKDYRMPMMLSTLKPETMRLNVKVIIIGSSNIYNMLITQDEEFKKLFKIKAEYEEEAEMNKENVKKLCIFISSYIREEGLLPVDKKAVEQLIEYASKLSGVQEKISTDFAEIGRVISEANVWALREKQTSITEKDIRKVFVERQDRIKKYDKKQAELIEKEIILIDTEGKSVGEINGLSITSFGEISFRKAC